MKPLQTLKDKLGENVQENVLLGQYSTFKLGGPARYFFIAKTSEDIVKAAEAAVAANLPIFLLAGGSNLLIADTGFDGLVIKAENRNIELRGETDIYAEGGAVWNDLVSFAAKHGLTGVEWGVGIPGSVGGAIRGNAGAFGESVHHVVKTVDVLQRTDDGVVKITMTNEQCNFEYRESIFKKDKNLIILGGLLALQIGNATTIKATMAERLTYRERTQPCLPSAGCTFKNMIVDDELREKIKHINPKGEELIKGGKIGSGWFIDQAGLKGYQIGGVKVSEEHANFIVKVDESARADHVVQLISYIKQQVRDKFGVQMHEEVQYVGF